ncbi:peptide deformylase 1B, chloroplastic-like [Camellia sinensis]|uniref:peptide deformylase 1B, chloroplastic-like n=1 Tax=Camellia sinensis TaxID=4442 RepID=UPI0010369599|nr:peptide deformylase 1B, chloroplastic-like [Camellia sinensis]
MWWKLHWLLITIAKLVIVGRVLSFSLLPAADLSFEAPLKIVEYPDPILRTKNRRIDTFDDNLKKLVDEMFDVMYKLAIEDYTDG